VALVAATGRALLEGEPAAGDDHIALAAGAAGQAEVRASNYCGPTPASPISVALDLATGDTVTAAPGPGASDAMAVPPCLGEDPGTIEMGPWQAP